jgi:hypothetical protein
VVKETFMFEFKTGIGIRNILLVQMLMIVLVPGYALQVRRELAKLWRTLKTPVFPKRTGPSKKGGKFWEIDLTKLEP